MKERKFQIGIKALILNKKKEVLVLKANPEELKGDTPVHWDLPGGRIKEGSGIEDTLREEVKEELGINQIEIIRLFDAMISKINVPEGKEILGLVLLVYLCRSNNTESDFKLSFEHTEYKWANLKEAKELLSLKFPKSFIDKLDGVVV